MRIICGMFLLITLALMGEGVDASMTAGAPRFMSLGALWSKTGLPWPSHLELGTIGGVDATAIAAWTINTLGKTPAVVIAAVLSVAFWLPVAIVGRPRKPLWRAARAANAPPPLATRPLPSHPAPPHDTATTATGHGTPPVLPQASFPLAPAPEPAPPDRPTNATAVTQSSPAPAVPAPTPAQQPPPPARAGPPPSARDAEFLPAALEILVTPPSPIASRLMLLICTAFAAALAWSYFGWLDIHAVAPGKIQPSGLTKVVQPLDAGKVVAVRVSNGSRVNVGDVLIELDPTETIAERDALARDLEAANAEAERRRAAIKATIESMPVLPAIAFKPGIGPTIRAREQSVLAADLAQQRAIVASLQAQLAEKQATRSRLLASIAARNKLIALSRERVAMREEIETRGAGSRALVIEALQQLESYLTLDAGERGQLLETDAGTHSLKRRIEAASTQFIAEQTQKLSEIERRRDRLVQELVKARSRSDRTQLKAPVAGTVQQLSVTTIGQVVASGQSLLAIVPLDGPIEVEAMIANKDIGFVHSGQPAVIKVEAFPFTRYGVIAAEVVRVSRDAVAERDAGTTNDATSTARAQRGASTAGTNSQGLVFPATLRLSRHSILVDGREIQLRSGMAVSVEIATGHRRAIDYVLSPLREVAGAAIRER